MYRKVEKMCTPNKVTLDGGLVESENEGVGESSG